MRLFFAVEFDDRVKDAVSRAIAGARIANPPWRWVARSNVHVTVKFLGETPEEHVPLLVEAVTPACAQLPPFQMELGGLGGFPNLNKPRVLFYEAIQGAGELAALARSVETALHDELSIAREDRPFRAHATVARVKRPIPPDIAARLQKAPPVEGGSQRVEKVSLMRSELHRDGARYALVKGIALSGSK